MRSRSRALFAITASAALGLAFAAPAGAARVHFSRTGRTRAAAVSETPRLTVVYQNLRLVNGDTATVYSNGLAEVRNADRSQVDYRNIPPASTAPAGVRATEPVRQVTPAPQRLQRGRAGTGAPSFGKIPDFTTDAALNRTLAGLGTDRMAAVFPGAAVAALRPEPGGLDLARAYVVHVTAAAMPAALAALTASGAVAYASPDWTVSTTATSPIPVPSATRRAADAASRRLAAPPARRAGGSPPPPPSHFALP